MIGIKYNNPTNVFLVLIDSEPSSDMILCKDKEGAEKILNEYMQKAMLDLLKEYRKSLDKIRRSE